MTQRSIRIYRRRLCRKVEVGSFLAHHRVFQASSSCETDDNEIATGVDVISLDQAPPSRILTEQEKYKKAFQVSQSLAQQLSSLGMNKFREGLSVLQTIKSMWDVGKKVVVVELDDSHEGNSIFKLKLFYCSSVN